MLRKLRRFRRISRNFSFFPFPEGIRFGRLFQAHALISRHINTHEFTCYPSQYSVLTYFQREPTRTIPPKRHPKHSFLSHVRTFLRVCGRSCIRTCACARASVRSCKRGAHLPKRNCIRTVCVRASMCVRNTSFKNSAECQTCAILAAAMRAQKGYQHP